MKYRYNEVWRELADFPNYLFSNQGRIKNRNTNRILKGSNNDHGYLTCRIKNNNGKFITKDIHRLIAKCFLSNFNNNLQVNHIDGNKHNNSIDNLEMVTGKENMAHAIKNTINRLFPKRGFCRRLQCFRYIFNILFYIDK